MPLPDPDMYDDWKAWAKARNQQDALEARRENNWISDYGPITDFESNWTTDPANPAAFCLFKNGYVALAGSIEATDHIIFSNMFTLPYAARPLTGHDFGGGELLISYTSALRTGAATNLFCYIRTDGQVRGAFGLSSQTTVLYLHDFTFRGRMAR
jgi:hypothetical protein